MENENQAKLVIIKNKIEEIKKFYKHVVFYIFINVLITFLGAFSFKIFGDFIVSNQYDENGFVHYPIWVVWGFFLALHALKTFVFPDVFGNSWKEKKIREFMNK
tara:strand:+ start:2277 stop:2588 length:312 start_codon:yes stop_codon:yes gene_type:complete